MIPSLDCLKARFRNETQTSLRVGNRRLDPGEEKDVDIKTLHGRIVDRIRSQGVEYVGLVCDGELMQMVSSDADVCDEDCTSDKPPEPEDQDPEPEPEPTETPESQEEDEPTETPESQEEDEPTEAPQRYDRIEQLQDENTKAELQEILEDLDLPISGNKPELAERIAQHENAT